MLNVIAEHEFGCSSVKDLEDQEGWYEGDIGGNYVGTSHLEIKRDGEGVVALMWALADSSLTEMQVDLLRINGQLGQLRCLEELAAC